MFSLGKLVHIMCVLYIVTCKPDFFKDLAKHHKIFSGFMTQ
uniref:Uncharacterized protein n=1 Tax=Arundo donax TaxID=35708 RepID=A0A0A9AT25_ARUDO